MFFSLLNFNEYQMKIELYLCAMLLTFKCLFLWVTNESQSFMMNAYRFENHTYFQTDLLMKQICESV